MLLDMLPMLVAVAVSIVLYVGVCIYERRWFRRACADFAQKFPGRCLICSLQQYGYYYGHETSPSPGGHDCIERRGRS